MRSQKFVMISFMVTVGGGMLAYYLPSEYRKQTFWEDEGGGEFPPMRFFIGAGLVYFGLSAVSEFKPTFAGPFAGLIMTTSLLFNGVPVATYLMEGDPQEGDGNEFAPDSLNAAKNTPGPEYTSAPRNPRQAGGHTATGRKVAPKERVRANPGLKYTTKPKPKAKPKRKRGTVKKRLSAFGKKIVKPKGVNIWKDGIK